MIRQRSFHKVWLLVILLAALFSLTACQGAERAPEPSFTSTEYVSSTDLYRLYVPTGWVTAEDIPGADLVVANSEVALEHYRNGNTPGSGELVLNVGFLPRALFQEEKLAHLGVQFDAPADVFLQSILPMFLAGEKPASSVAGEVELVSLGEGRDAGRLRLAEESREGCILLFTSDNKVFAVVSATVFPGEIQDFQEIIYAIAAGITYTGSQDTLYQKLYGD